MVVDLGEYRASRKEWTKGELRVLEGFLRSLRRWDEAYALVHIETDQGEYVAVFVPGDRDATHSVTKERDAFVSWCESARQAKRDENLRVLLESWMKSTGADPGRLLSE